METMSKENKTAKHTGDNGNDFIADVRPSVVYLVTNEDKMTVESGHWKKKDAKKEVDDWHRYQPQFQFMVIELKIH